MVVSPSPPHSPSPDWINYFSLSVLKIQHAFFFHWRYFFLLGLLINIWDKETFFLNSDDNLETDLINRRLIFLQPTTQLCERCQQLGSNPVVINKMRFKLCWGSGPGSENGMSHSPGFENASLTVRGLKMTSLTVQDLKMASLTVRGLKMASLTVRGLKMTSLTVQDLKMASLTVQGLKMHLSLSRVWKLHLSKFRVWKWHLSLFRV